MRISIFKIRKSAFYMLLMFVILTLTNGQAKAEEPSWLWAISAQGSGNDAVASLATDTEGNIYATGAFMSPTLDFGDFTINHTGLDYNYYLAKFTSDGDILWATSAGGDSRDSGSGVAVDQEGNVYVVVSFHSDSITIGDFTFHNQGSRDIFLAKYSASGDVLWATHAGGSEWDIAADLAIDAFGNVYITGRFISSSLTFGSVTLSNNDDADDIFIAKYDSQGNVLWAKSVGGPQADYAWDITTDISGNVYVAGHFNSPQITFGSTTLQKIGDRDALLLKYDANGNELWARSASGNGDNRAIAVASDASGNVYLGGTFTSSSLDFGNTTLSNSGSFDGFVAKYDEDGNFKWSTGIGSPGQDGISDLAIDHTGNVLVAGSFGGPGISIGSVFLTNSGQRDLFVAGYDPQGNPLWAKGAGGSADDRAMAVTIDATGNIYVGGLYGSESIALGSHSLTNYDSGENLYISKLDGGLVAAPQTLLATAQSGSSIQLQWEANSKNDPVLLAYSVDGSFGSPVTGQIYNVGETLPGGGKVLYFGQGQDFFTHSGLEFLTSYYYRAWSYNTEYSNPQSASAATSCPDGYTLPFFEDFNADTQLPDCWSVSGNNVPSASNWKIGIFSNGLAHSTGNYAWVELQGNALRTAVLISPMFDFGGYTDVDVTFKHRYNHAHADAIFAFTTDGGNTWQTLDSWGSNTGNATYNGQLDVLAGVADVQFGWILETRGTGPNRAVRSWSVDDIQVSATLAGITYTIFAAAGNGGAISPSGNIQVGEGQDQSFNITADSGFAIADVLVDNVSVGAMSSYTFINVQSDHSIQALFEQLPVITYVITAGAGPGGTIDPSGEVSVQEGDDQTFNFMPNSGYVVEDVVVDNISLGAMGSYTFMNVSGNHDIFVSFDLAPADPCLISSLPYLQDFNAASEIPECWENAINDGNTGWSVGSFSGGLSGATGNYAYFYYQGNQSQNADLISPPFDFSEYTEIHLSFTHYHDANRSSAGVYYSTDGGNSWVAIQTWNNTTANLESFSQDLSFLAGQTNVLFRWNMDFSGGGPPRNFRSWSVDDVLVVGSVNQQSNAAMPNMDNVEIYSDDFKITLYPNPVSDLLNIYFNNDLEKGLLVVTDMQGRQVYYDEINNTANGQLMQININQWRSGAYIVSFIGSGTVVNQMIMKR